MAQRLNKQLQIPWLEYQIGIEYQDLGLNNNAKILLNQAVEEYKRLKSNFLPWVLFELGTIYMDRALDEARALFSQALKLYSRYFRPKYLRTLDATFNLGGINYLQKKPDQAMQYFEKAKQSYQDIHNHKSVFKTIYYIGKVFKL